MRARVCINKLGNGSHGQTVMNLTKIIMWCRSPVGVLSSCELQHIDGAFSNALRCACRSFVDPGTSCDLRLVRIEEQMYWSSVLPLMVIPKYSQSSHVLRISDRRHPKTVQSQLGFYWISFQKSPGWVVHRI